jgi:hypothetical protein
MSFYPFQLREIIREFAAFVAQRGVVSEADTRMKMINKVLGQVWLICWTIQSVFRHEVASQKTRRLRGNTRRSSAPLR